MNYIPRISDTLLKKLLESTVAVLVEGAKWCGKTQSSLQAANSLIKISQKIDTEKMNQPSFLMVLTGGQVAYKRTDGVLVVPLGCLRD